MDGRDMVPGYKSMVKSFKLQASGFPDQVKAPSTKRQASSFKPPKAAATLCRIDTRCSGATKMHKIIIDNWIMILYNSGQD